MVGYERRRLMFVLTLHKAKASFYLNISLQFSNQFTTKNLQSGLLWPHAVISIVLRFYARISDWNSWVHDSKSKMNIKNNWRYFQTNDVFTGRNEYTTKTKLSRFYSFTFFSVSFCFLISFLSTSIQSISRNSSPIKKKLQIPRSWIMLCAVAWG